MPNESAPDYVARAFELADLVRSAASAGEASGQVDSRVTAAFAAAGFFRMMVPRLLGGGEADALTMVETIDAVSRADGAAGWTVMIGATTGTSSTQLPLEGAREIFGDPNGLVVGVVAPRGRAVRVEGGFRVTGTWPFGSGSGAANWIAGGAVVQGPEGPELITDNVPHARMMFFRRSDVSIEDTWHVSGLRGTGSNDFSVTDVFVPGHHSYAMGAHSDWADSPAFRFPFFGLLATGVAAVATGIGRAAIDELARLAAAKTPTGSRRLLAERAATQSGIAEAEALLRSGRGFLLGTIRETWDAVQTGERITTAQKALLRLAATTAALNAAKAVDICYNLGGASSIYESNPLQRHFRDIHTVTQHVMVGQPTLEVAGRIMLGLPTDTSTL